MLALIISDTHGDDSRILTIRRSLSENLDVLIHAGDIGGSEQFYRDYLRCQCHIVCGNTDWSGRLPETDTFFLGPHRVFLTHGHRYHVDFAGPEAVADAARQKSCVQKIQPLHPTGLLFLKQNHWLAQYPKHAKAHHRSLRD